MSSSLKRRRFMPVVIAPSLLDSIERRRERERAKEGNKIKVKGYERVAGPYLSVRERKALAFAEVERLCRLADVHGVTAEDKRAAAIAVHLLIDAFKPEGVRLVAPEDIRAIERVRAKGKMQRASGTRKPRQALRLAV